MICLMGSLPFNTEEALTSKKQCDSDNDDASSNSYMDSLFGLDDEFSGPSEQTPSDHRGHLVLHRNVSQNRQQEHMQHQMRLMLESSASSRYHQKPPMSAEAGKAQQTPATAGTHQSVVSSSDRSSPAFPQSVTSSTLAYKGLPDPIDSSEVSQPTISRSATLHLETLLKESATRNTPLARLYAMAGEFFPSLPQEPAPPNRRKRLGGGDSNTPFVPVTSMSPSLVISTLEFPRVAKKQKIISSKGTKPPSQSPQHVLDEILRSNGLPLYRVCAVEAKYDTLPSQLQLGSYGVAVMRAMACTDVEALDVLLKAGLSPNPCNQFRDSLLDYACETSNEAVFHCFLRHKADLRVCDGFGRTPLHYCAWSVVFNESIVRAILENDPQQLYQEDKQGHTPLEVVTKSAAQGWIDFLVKEKDRLLQSLPALQNMERRVQLSDPANPLSVEAAKSVSSGRIAPEALSAQLSPLTAPPSNSKQGQRKL